MALAALCARRGGVAVLDGGMGTGLGALGLTESECWSAGTRLGEQRIRDAVTEVHLLYLRAGADILTANTYNVSAARDERDGRQPAERQHLEANMLLAQQAIAAFARERPDAPPPLLAASMGSYATSLSRAETANRAADDLAGERISGYGLGQGRLEEFHRSRAATVLAAGAQLLAFETIPDLVEARAIAAVLEQLQAQEGAGTIEAWVTFTCRDAGAGDGICDHGDLFEDCVRAVAGCAIVVGVGFNCTEPHLAPMLLRTARAIVGDDKLLVCYPNSGEMYDTTISGGSEAWRTVDGSPPPVGGPAEFAAMARHWRAEGADVVGGCCRIGPEEIAAVSEAFPRGQSSGGAA